MGFRSRLGGTSLIAVLMAVSCSQAPSYVIVHQPVATVNVTPAFDTIPFGGAVSLKVSTLDLNGDPTIPDKHPVWSSLNTAVLRVDTSGNVAAVWNGQGTIRVVVDGVEGDATITVLVPPITSVTVGPVGLTPERGDTVHFSASARNSAGLPAIINHVTWSSSDTTRLRIDSTGRAVAVGVGPVQVTGVVDTVSGTAGVTVLVPVVTVTVTPGTVSLALDDTASVQAVARDSAGNVLVNRSIHVSSPSQLQLQTQLLPSGLLVSLHSIASGRTSIVAAAGRVADTISVAVSPIRFLSVAPGAISTCGLTTDSAAFCWGAGVGGELGNADWSDGPRPRRVIGGHKFAALYGGNGFNCGLTADGSAWCWGENIGGDLGRDGPDTMVPGPVTGGYHFAMLSSEGATCGVTTIGQAYCWGNNWSSTPAPIGAAGVFSRVSVGGGGYCGTRAIDDSIMCWNPTYQTPVMLSASQPVVLQANGQWDASCGLAGGSAYCWGSWPYSDNGGTGIFFASRFPGTSFTTVADGGGFFCGITTAGAVLCRGSDEQGQLGDGGGQFSDTLVTALTPVKLLTLLSGQNHMCGMGADGLAYCWGSNVFGQTGVAPGGPNTPQPVMDQQ